jgi:cytochrome P450 PksS
MASETRIEDQFPELVKLISRSFMQRPYEALAEMRESRAATPIENNGMRMWVVGRYEDARTVLADSSLKKDLVVKRKEILQQSMVRPERRPRLPLEIRRNMLDRDEPDHLRLRGLLAKSFTSANVERLRPKIQEVAAQLLNVIPVGRPIDLINEFTRPLSVTIIADLLGVPPEDRAGFPTWENDILTSPDIPMIEEAGAELVTFAQRMIERRRAEPDDGMISGLIDDHTRGELDEVELISMVTLMLIAGMEPGSAISNGVFTLLGQREQLDALIDCMDLLPGCIDEILRYESPFRMLTPRYSGCPMELGGTTIPANELILVSVAAANRDPSHFIDPNRFDIARTTKGHLGFGRGNHRCLGAQLGWQEMEIALTALLTRFDIELACDPGDVQWRTGMFMRRLDALPVVLAEK